jgi:hypothetical protein
MFNRISGLIAEGKPKSRSVWFAAHVDVELPSDFDPESQDAGRLVSEAIARQYPELTGRIQINGETCMEIEGTPIKATSPLV